MNRILRILDDNRLHVISELVSAADVSDDRIEAFIQFLPSYQIIVTDKGRKTAILSADYATLK